MGYSEISYCNYCSQNNNQIFQLNHALLLHPISEYNNIEILYHYATQ